MPVALEVLTSVPDAIGGVFRVATDRTVMQVAGRIPTPRRPP